jgi:hypothetical protein
MQKEHDAKINWSSPEKDQKFCPMNLSIRVIGGVKPD